VSFWLGSGDATQARHAIKLGLAGVFGTGLLMSGLLLALRHLLVPIYTASSEVAALAVPMLAWVALYHVFDGLQSVGLFVLRCFRVAFLPFVIYAVLLWGGGLGGGYLLAYQGLGPWAPMHSPMAFWIMSAMALGATAMALLVLLRVAAKDQD
jgi:multidrug resistance protein, MATE family